MLQKGCFAPSVCFEGVTNLRTNSSPQIVFAKFMVLVDWLKPHGMKIFWPQRRCEDILGRPEDQLGTPECGAPDTKIVKVDLELGDIVARGLDGRNARGVAPPETAVVNGVVFAVLG